MKLNLSAIVFVAFTAVTSETACGQELRGAITERSLSDCPYVQIYFAFFGGPGVCIGASGEGANSRVYLGQDCTDLCPPDENGLMRKVGTDLCLQASHGFVVEDGSKMRLYPCDENNKFQQFSWIDDSNPHRLQLKNNEYSSLCATNRGTQANIGDPIIFKVCDLLRPVERQEWWGD